MQPCLGLCCFVLSVLAVLAVFPPSSCDPRDGVLSCLPCSEGPVMLLVQWHRTCYPAGTLLPCDVTCLEDDFSLVEPASVVRVVLAVPQFCDLGVPQEERTIGTDTAKRPFVLCAMASPFSVG